MRLAGDSVVASCPTETNATVTNAEDYYAFVWKRIRQLAPRAILLRGPAHLNPAQASSGSSDLDILILTDDPAPVKGFLKEQDFCRVYKPQTYLERFRRWVPEVREPYSIDLYSAERWGLGFRLANYGHVPADPRLACLLHAVADGKGAAYFERKQNGTPWQQENNGKVTFGPFGRALWRTGRSELVTVYLLLTGVIRPEPSMILRNLCRRIAYRTWQLARKTGLEVALLGVDGTGKSSVANALLGLPAPVTVVYMGPHDYRTRIMRFIVKHKLPVPFRQVVFRYDLLVRRLSGWLYARRGRIVIYDRHPAERLEPRQRSRRNMIKNVLEHLSAWPVDLTFWLSGDYQALYQRKPEYSPAQLQATEERYRSVLERYRIPFEKIDVTKNDLHSVTEMVSKGVLAKYHEHTSINSLPRILREMLT